MYVCDMEKHGETQWQIGVVLIIQVNEYIRLKEVKQVQKLKVQKGISYTEANNIVSRKVIQSIATVV